MPSPYQYVIFYEVTSHNILQEHFFHFIHTLYTRERNTPRIKTYKTEIKLRAHFVV